MALFCHFLQCFPQYRCGTFPVCLSFFFPVTSFSSVFYKVTTENTHVEEECLYNAAYFKIAVVPNGIGPIQLLALLNNDITWP